MKDDEQIVFEPEDDPLPKAAERGDAFPADVGRSGVDRAEDERAGEPELAKRMAEHACRERFEVDGYVGKFRHNLSIMTIVRIMKVLIGGWLIGGAFIVFLSLPGIAKPQAVGAAPAAPVVPAAATPHAGPWTGSIVVPVLGIDPSALRDNFDHMRGGGRTHHALDIMAPRGTPVVAAVDGTVRKLFNSKAGGLSIYQFDRAEERVYYYAHLDRYADGIAEGLLVTQGTVIGYVGTTGNAAPDSPHLHFSVEVLSPTKEWWKGTPVNPYPLLVR